MGITIEKEYVVLASIVDIGGQGTKKEVLDNIYNKKYIMLNSEDLKEKENRKELKWRNDLAFTRKGLQSKGYIDGEEKNNWKITEEGKKYLENICREISDKSYKIIKLTRQAVQRANENTFYYTKEYNCIIKEESEEYLNLMYEGFPEGQEKERLHKYKERNPKVIKKAKEIFKLKNGSLYCEICGFNFEQVYGEIGREYIEGHHIKPISELKDEDVTDINDILLVCANCHRMLHIQRPCLPKEELLKLINSAK